MTFLSYEFVFAFLPILLIVYYLCRLSHTAVLQNAVLFAASLVFYGFYGLDNACILLFCILITFFGGLLGRRKMDEGKRSGKVILLTALVLNLLVLCVFKYSGFFVQNLNKVLRRLPFGECPLPQIFLPVGLSFYVFQSSTYLIDLLRGQVRLETNPITYGAFVSFFPTVISGPILKSKEMLEKFRVKRSLSFYQFQAAALEFVWGAFLKKVISDRIALFTDKVYTDYSIAGGSVLLIAAILYSLQIYADFYGYSCMAAAVARLLGFRLPDNFFQPYFADSMQDFWHRWHISLSTWFTRYLYIPLGGNRCGWLRRNLNIIVVFLVSGLWHGADWSFVFWGALHAAFQVLEKPIMKHPYKTKAVRFVRVLYTAAASTFAWIFFRSDNIKQGLVIVKQIFTDFRPWYLFDDTLLKFGLSGLEWNILIFSLAVLLVVSLVREQNRHIHIMREPWWARFAVFFFLFFMTVIYGLYGPSYDAKNFIYSGF